MSVVLTLGAPASAGPPAVEVVVDGLEFPTGIAFSTDGSLMYVNEREGRVRVVDANGLRSEPLATIPTTTAGETGLLGIAVSPDDAYLYLFATDPGGGSNRVLRIPATGGDEKVIVSDLPASVYHNGGGVAFDRDGRLLVSNGETHQSSDAQDVDVRGGKVYRFEPDGSVAEGNPFGEAIALGLRNPFGMTVDPVTGDAFVTDNGPSSHDEINRVQVGGNYGWPDVLGAAGGARPSGPGEYHDPISVQEETVVPTGIAIADPAAAVPDAAGDLFYGTYEEPSVRRVELNDARDSAISDEVFIREEEPVIALAWGPRGLYYSTTSAIKVVLLADETKRRSPSGFLPSDGERDDAPASGGGIGPIYVVAIAVAIGLIALVLLRRRFP